MEYKFEDLPRAMSELHSKVDEMMVLLTKLLSENKKEELLLDIEQAANLLNLEVSTVYSKVSKRALPGVCKRGKSLYFIKDELIKYIIAGKIKTSGELKTKAAKITSNFSRRW